MNDDNVCMSDYNYDIKISRLEKRGKNDVDDVNIDVNSIVIELNGRQQSKMSRKMPMNEESACV